MGVESSLGSNVERRTFLKGTAALVGLAAVSGTGCVQGGSQVSADNQVEDEVYQGLCRGNCGGGCRLEVHVREGKVVQTNPIVNPEEPLNDLICARGYTHTQRMYAPERIQYPVRRVEGSQRGAGEWERLSWDEAIAYICEKWKGYRRQFGNSSIVYSYGAGTYGQNYYVYMRLFSSLGAMTLHQENDMTMLNYSWRIFGMSLYLVGNSRKDEVNARTIFVWGCNASIGTFNRWKYLMAARDNGARIVVIDPNYTAAAQHADLWVPIKPTTDGALALAMMNYWIENDLDDKEYLRTMTVAPFLVREDNGMFLRADDIGLPWTPAASQGGATSNSAWTSGAAAESSPAVVMGADGTPGLVNEVSDPQIRGEFEIQGIKVKTAYEMLAERAAEWPIAKAADFCELSPDLIERIAKMYLDGPTTLHPGFGIDHWTNGDSHGHALFCLPLVSGQMGKPGATISGNLGGATTGFAGDNWTAVATSHYTPGDSTTMTYFPEIMETGMWNNQPTQVKSVYFYASNPLGSYSGGTALRAALDKVELVITADTVWNDTTKYSDVVLPVPHWFEYETYRTCPNEYLDFNDAAVPPQFESKPDTEIVALLGQGMDLNEYGEFSFDNDEIHSMFLDTEVSAMYGISWATLKQVKHMRMAPDEYNYGSKEVPFGTATGRAEFYIEGIVPEFDRTKNVDSRKYALPFQAAPIEANDDNPLREKYPIVLMTHRDKFKVHTAFAKCPWLLEIQPEPTIEINPIDAEKYGISENDYVKAYNDRGFVVLRAHLDASMHPGYTWIEHTWLDDQYVAGHYSDVTALNDNHVYPSNHPFDTLVALEKYQKEA